MEAFALYCPRLPGSQANQRAKKPQKSGPLAPFHLYLVHFVQLGPGEVSRWYADVDDKTEG